MNAFHLRPEAKHTRSGNVGPSHAYYSGDSNIESWPIMGYSNTSSSIHLSIFYDGILIQTTILCLHITILSYTGLFKKEVYTFKNLIYKYYCTYDDVLYID
jgi:hypothetical protein